MMAQGKQQNGWDSPKFTIDCVLANATRQLEADGCVLERLETGCKLTTPDHLTAGDFVKVQLWLEGEEAFIDIRLAEVRRVHGHRIAVEVIQVSPNDRIRLKRFIDAAAVMHIEEPALINHLLIRA
jgi:PilZ domain